MNASRSLIVLSVLIVILAGLAAIIGVASNKIGQPAFVTSIYGQIVPLRGRGIYQHDSISMAAQARAQDVVTLLIGIPLLAFSLPMTLKGSIGGKLLLVGTLGYFLYTYTSLTFLASYNRLFLVYVAVFSLSLFALILAFRHVDVDSLPGRFTEKLPVKWIAGFLTFISLMLLLMWGGRIVPSLTSYVAPYGLEHYTTLVIQALDLGVIVPLGFLAAVLLWRGRPWGYMLSALMLIKGLTLLLAICAMIVAQGLAGVSMAPVEMVVFPLFAVIDLVLVIILFGSIKPVKR